MRRLVIDHCNMVFGRSQDSQRYWRITLKRRLCESFSCNAGLTAEELHESFDLKVPPLNNVCFLRFVFLDVCNAGFDLSR